MAKATRVKRRVPALGICGPVPRTTATVPAFATRSTTSHEAVELGKCGIDARANAKAAELVVVDGDGDYAMLAPKDDRATHSARSPQPPRWRCRTRIRVCDLCAGVRCHSGEARPPSSRAGKFNRSSLRFGPIPWWERQGLTDREVVRGRMGTDFLKLADVVVHSLGSSHQGPHVGYLVAAHIEQAGAVRREQPLVQAGRVVVHVELGE